MLWPQARLAAIEAAALQARNGVEIARAALRLVLALEATEPVAVRPSGELAATVPRDLDDALQRACERRAELAAARALGAIHAGAYRARAGFAFPGALVALAAFMTSAAFQLPVVVVLPVGARQTVPLPAGGA